MECYEARALKSSFLDEIIGMKSTQQPLFDDFWCVANINNVVNVSSDEFSVDDLLDLSDKEFSDPGRDSFEESNEEDFASVSSNYSMNSSSFSTANDFVSLTVDQLTVPIDDMESLEWLSQIVDDSVSELPTVYPAVKTVNRPERVVMNRFEPAVNFSSRSFTVLGLPYAVPKKCRTGSGRKPGRVWSYSVGSRALTESSSSPTSSHDSSRTVYLTEPAAKKQRKSQACQNGPGSSELLSQRRCTHCQVQKTPQWRTGPLGPKTLCNACGVRFKSGRLFPEYRPACSPTFLGDVHSNSHRKVLEMRKRKEPEVEPGCNMVVQMGSSQMIGPVFVV